MNHIEQGDRFVGFVGLKLPDQMQLHAGVALLQRGPFGRRFLNAVFTEEHLAFVQALLQPPEPNARLKRAAKAYLRRGGQRAGA
jgi:hypothetical protein